MDTNIQTSLKDLTENFGELYYPTSAIVFYQTTHPQPQNEEMIGVENLPFVTEEFYDFFVSADQNEDTPSCSLADALLKQDLFINATLSQMGASLLWNLFRNGLTDKRGFFLNLQDFRSQPIFV